MVQGTSTWCLVQQVPVPSGRSRASMQMYIGLVLYPASLYRNQNSIMREIDFNPYCLLWCRLRERVANKD